MNQEYDAIVVGARCAGSPTAMLLARKGWRVLLVDHATFPSDTVSTHVVQPLGVACLSRWGLLDRLVATGCPPVHTYFYDFGPFTIEGSPGTTKFPVAYAPRRTVLDHLLVQGATEAGAELRQGFTVDKIVTEKGRAVGIEGHTKEGKATARARFVVGADGRGSLVAATMKPETTHERAPILAPYYTYWSGLPMRGRFETYIRPMRGFAAVETHDGLTMVVAGWPMSEFEANKRDVEASYLAAIAMAPEFAARLKKAKREAKLAGMPVPNFFRKPYGPGWILVGDAGYDKDPITAQGIVDAFHDAERFSAALDASLRDEKAFDRVMGEAHRARDAALPMFELTCTLATLEPPPPDLQKILGAAARNRRSMDRFAQMNAGTISPTEFFAPDSVNAIFAAAASAGS